MKKKILLLLSLLMVLCVGVASAASGDEKYVLPYLKGNWYDANGNKVLTVDESTVNGCPIEGVYQIAGKGGSFGCHLRIIEQNGYRDLEISHFPLQEHTFMILNKATYLRHTPENHYFESVGGIALGDSPDKVRKNYGEPNRIEKVTEGPDIMDAWVYDNQKMIIFMQYGSVWKIGINREGDRHFDQSGFNCYNSPEEFEEHYGHKIINMGENFKWGKLGHGEQINFAKWPYGLVLEYEAING